MSLDHITHHLACAECQETLRSGVSSPRGAGQCTLDLNDSGVACPHPREPGSDFCRIHGPAVLQARAEMEKAELRETIEHADRSLAEHREKLRELDELIRQAGEQGWSQTQLFPHQVGRDRMVTELGRILAIKQEAEAALAAMGRG